MILKDEKKWKRCIKDGLRLKKGFKNWGPLALQVLVLVPGQLNPGFQSLLCRLAANWIQAERVLTEQGVGARGAPP